jgi:hypothetical protein
MMAVGVIAMAQKPQRRREKLTAPAIDPDDPPEMTIDEVADRYPGQWFLMRVTGENEYKHAWRGHILAVSPDERQINEALSREPRRSELPPGVKPGRYVVSQAYRPIYPGPELDAWLARIRAQQTTDGHRAQS